MPRTLRLLISLVLFPAATAGQVLAGMGDPITQSDLLYFAGDAEAAYDILAGLVEADPTDYQALWRIARAGVVAGLEREENREQNAYLDPALHYAKLAVAENPEGMEGRYWRGVAAGRRAMNAAPGYSAELAQITHEDAHLILAVDSLHAGAHNMLGKLNYEVMILSRLERLVARTFMGNDAIKDTSWEKAEHHLARAVEVAPDFVLFRFDLARLYERRGRDEEAIAQLEEALRLPPSQPVDARVRRQATELLEEIIR